jgi:hypothetical protein
LWRRRREFAPREGYLGTRTESARCAKQRRLKHADIGRGGRGRGLAKLLQHAIKVSAVGTVVRVNHLRCAMQPESVYGSCRDGTKRDFAAAGLVLVCSWCCSWCLPPSSFSPPLSFGAATMAQVSDAMLLGALWVLSCGCAGVRVGGLIFAENREAKGARWR